MKTIKNWLIRKLIIRVFAKTSTSKTFENKEAGAITLFDAYEVYK